PQLSSWSAPNPCNSSTVGPAPRAVYAMRAPSKDRTKSGMKGPLRGADELGRHRIEVERVGISHRQQRDPAQGADEDRGVGDGIDVVTDFAALDSLAEIVLDHRAHGAVQPVDGGKERGLRSERLTQEHARRPDLQLGAAQAVDVDP